MPFTTANDIRIYYEIHGEGTPLFLVSGFSQNHLSWRKFVAPLSKHFQVICFDNRGVGQTEVPQEGYSLKMLTEDVAALMQKLDIKNAHFIGESLGAAMILQLCIDHPDRVKKAVLCAPFPYFPEIVKNTVRSQLKLISEGVSYFTLMEMNASWLLSNPFLSVPGNLENYLQEMRSNPFPLTREGLLGQAQALLNFDLRSHLKNIDHEILLLIGERDIATPPYCAEEIFKHVRAASKHLFKDVGHQFNYEIPQQSVKHALAFLRKI